MKILLKLPVVILSLSLAACAGNRTAASSSSDDYVEVDNPYITMGKDAPAKIWVPRSSVDNGVPRGGELLKKGASEVVNTFKGSPSEPQQGAASQQQRSDAAIPSVPPQQQNAAATVQPPLATAPPSPETIPTPRKRIALMDVGQNGLAKALYEKLLKTSPTETVLDPTQTAIQAGSTNESQSEKGAISRQLQKDSSANIAVFISAAAGVAPGKTIDAEIYDTTGGGLIKRFDALIPQYSETDKNARDAAVSAAVGAIGNRIRELIAFIPWYGRIIGVEGKLLYIAAGKETGLKRGQVLVVYHPGKFVEGLGYAPGGKTGEATVTGFIGPDGSIALLREGQTAQVTDVIAAE